LYTTEDIYNLHRALEPFDDLDQLRRFAAERKDIYELLRKDIYEPLRVDRPTREVRAILETLAAVLRPVEREQLKSPTELLPYSWPRWEASTGKN